MLFFAYGLGLRAPDEITPGAVLRAPVGARVPPVRSQDSLTQGAPCPSCLRAPGIAPARPIVGRRLSAQVKHLGALPPALLNVHRGGHKACS